MNIREAALGQPQNLEAALAASIKAAQSASAALESLTVSLMLAASFLRQPEAPTTESGECRHLNTMEIQTMGGGNPQVLCADCGNTISDAMHHDGA